jgi:hypothetical protein
MGGNNPSSSNVIQYVTIASAGNAIDFGDLTVVASGCAGASSETRGLRAGGENVGTTSNSNVIDYITIASTGNTTDFGDLTRTMDDGVAGCSNGHGGLS